MSKPTAYQLRKLKNSGIKFKQLPDGNISMDIVSMNQNQVNFIKQILFEKRQSGNTIRLVDRCVQELFTKGVTFIYEGRGEKNEKLQTKYALKLFKRRMAVEHRHIEYDEKFVSEETISYFKVTLK